MDSKIVKKLTTMTAVVLLLFVASTWAQHPGPQPVDGSPGQPGPDWTLVVSPDGETSYYQTATSVFPDAQETLKTSPPNNLLPTIYEPMRDSGGDIIPNSLPSTLEHPYNLHPDPIITDIDPRSPRWDLGMIIFELKAAVDSKFRAAVNKKKFKDGESIPADPRRGRIERGGSSGVPIITADASNVIDYDRVQFAIDILEGNPVDRTYSGMGLLNYKGPEMVKTVDPVTKTVDVHQSWQHSRISSDTMFIDPSTIPKDEPWTIRYTVDNLFWGEEDFAPLATYFDDPDDLGRIQPHFQIDQTFFPMLPGHRYVFEIAMAPHKYYNLTYHWGWRAHPPRIQAIEKATKMVGPKNIVQWERDVFGDNPSQNETTKLAAISMLSDLAPAKRMWLAMRAIKDTQQNNLPDGQKQLLVEEIEAAYDDWNHRQRLPRGVEQAEGDFDETIVYMNNTLYGGMHRVVNGSQAAHTWDAWQTRGEVLKVKLLNGDYFPHLYMNVDFGGRRGWENIFQHTLALGGQGPLFTFGRTHWWPNLSKPAEVPAASRFGEQTSGTVKLSELGGEADLKGRLLDLSEFGLGDNGSDRGTISSSSSKELAKRRAATIRSVPAVSNAERSMARAKGYDLKQTPFWLRLPDQAPALVRTVGGLGEHNVEIEFRFDPSQRIRFYQFDPSHHNQAILTIH